MKHKMFIPVLALTLLALPAGAGASDLVLRNLDVSIGIHSTRPPREPRVVHVYEEDRHDRRDHRHHRKEWREERRHRREEPQVIVIDRDRHHQCNDERYVIARPGTVVVVGDGRRW